MDFFVISANFTRC